MQERGKRNQALMKDKSKRIKAIYKTLGASRATLYCSVSPRGEIRQYQQTRK